MFTIIAERGAGKTAALIRQSAETGACIVCKDIRMAEYIQKMCIDLNVSIPQPLTYDEFLRHSYCGKSISAFLIDDADILLQKIANTVPVKAITISIQNYT